MNDVTAIWINYTGSRRDHTRRPDEYRAAVRIGNNEQQVIIDQPAYDALAAQATADDYREGSYIAFDRRLEWSDVFAEDRVP